MRKITITVDEGSLSARRAWIEMVKYRKSCPASVVALRKESVDRNKTAVKGYFRALESLSARRAWIEIGCWLPDHSWWLVALRKESVDRNPAG